MSLQGEKRVTFILNAPHQVRALTRMRVDSRCQAQKRSFRDFDVKSAGAAAGGVALCTAAVNSGVRARVGGGRSGGTLVRSVWTPNPSLRSVHQDTAGLRLSQWDFKDPHLRCRFITGGSLAYFWINKLKLSGVEFHLRDRFLSFCCVSIPEFLFSPLQLRDFSKSHRPMNTCCHGIRDFPVQSPL